MRVRDELRDNHHLRPRTSVDPGGWLNGSYLRKCAGQGTLVIASDEEAVGSNPATLTRNRRSEPLHHDFLINFVAPTAEKYSSGHSRTAKRTCQVAAEDADMPALVGCDRP